MTNWFKLLHIAPSRSSTTVILHPTLNGLFFLYIRMYKCKTISELHLPKTSFAAASQTQGVYFIQSFFFNIGSLKVIGAILECCCTNVLGCLSDQQSTLSAFIVFQLYCNCRRTRQLIMMFNKESAL